MPPESISASKSSSAAPLAAGLEVTLAHKLLLARVKSFMALAVMLPGKSLAADRAHERSFVSVSAQVRSQIVRSSKTLRAEAALERGRVLLYALRTRWLACLWFGKAEGQNVVGHR